MPSVPAAAAVPSLAARVAPFAATGGASGDATASGARRGRERPADTRICGFSARDGSNAQQRSALVDRPSRFAALHDLCERCDAAVAGVGEDAGEDGDEGALEAGLVLYVAGAARLAGGEPARAEKLLRRAVRRAPLNWSAWLALARAQAQVNAGHEGDEGAEAGGKVHTDAAKGAALVEPGDEGAALMEVLFRAHSRLEAQRPEEALQLLSGAEVAPVQGAAYVKLQKALCQYGERDFDSAERAFEELMRENPDSLDGLDTYSNILYVKNETARLSQLAHHAVSVDKFRPETCVIIGNFYSMRGDHQSAVLNFMRALRLDPSFIAAWTLMGHDYVEMKNTSAAVRAYRRAVELNPQDYRAWYGLGQTYELLDMAYFALFYYRKATALRPYDSRMWTAAATVYERIGKPRDAIRCFERALSNGDKEQLSLLHLASLHKRLNEQERSAFYYEMFLKLPAAQNPSGTEQASVCDALLFLGQYYFGLGMHKEAAAHCTRLLEFGGPQKQEAKGILQAIQAAA